MEAGFTPAPAPRALPFLPDKHPTLPAGDQPLLAQVLVHCPLCWGCPHTPRHGLGQRGVWLLRVPGVAVC